VLYLAEHPTTTVERFFDPVRNAVRKRGHCFLSFYSLLLQLAAMFSCFRDNSFEYTCIYLNALKTVSLTSDQEEAVADNDSDDISLQSLHQSELATS
jgi:hypothetical protein